MNRRWIVVGLIFLGILVNYIDRGNLSIAADSIMREFHLPPSSMGVLLSAFFWTYAFCQLPAGYLVDRYGIRIVYAAGFILWSLASAGMALSRHSGDILALRMVLGLAESVAPLASIAFIRQNFSGHEQGLPTAAYISGQNLGPACGALIGTALLANFGWRVMFAVTGLGALIFIPFWLFIAPRRHQEQMPQHQAASSLHQRQWRSVLSNQAFWAMSACVFCFSYYWYFLLTWMPAYLTLARGFSTTGMGRILSAPLFTMAVLNLGVGWLADRLVARSGAVFQTRILFAAAGLVGASSILLLNVIPGRAPVLPILVISICSFGVTSSSYWAIAQYAPPTFLVGRSIGYLNTLSQTAGAIAPVITGWSLGPAKDFRFAILSAGVAPLIACVLLFTAGRGLEKLKRELAATDPGTWEFETRTR
jgi:ACS family D-galactonate transporter-like MFS transporter